MDTVDATDFPSRSNATLLRLSNISPISAPPRHDQFEEIATWREQVTLASESRTGSNVAEAFMWLSGPMVMSRPCQDRVRCPSATPHCPSMRLVAPQCPKQPVAANVSCDIGTLEAAVLAGNCLTSSLAKSPSTTHSRQLAPPRGTANAGQSSTCGPSRYCRPFRTSSTTALPVILSSIGGPVYRLPPARQYYRTLTESGVPVCTSRWAGNGTPTEALDTALYPVPRTVDPWQRLLEYRGRNRALTPGDSSAASDRQLCSMYVRRARR
ncbi:hypothetical protein F5144DRAFT_590036 [Chaetomium tenue]|uniref:Uncharacterized protein n=1 Tax=Chaetomium tenue TaxID=1854479 RepID=A0ACB7PJM8_9PEZI|nr:hypothetical protein F5144DRAFT_590036 [Chaetomium globosum]